MTMETNETSAVSAAETNGTGTSAGRRRGGGSPLRKLTDEQELELTRLYTETETPVAELARRFAVGESSVYRTIQKHGATLRGPKSAAGAGTKPKAQAGATPRSKAAGTHVEPAATLAARAPRRRGQRAAAPATRGAATGRTSRGAARQTASAGAAASRARTASQRPQRQAAARGVLRRFRIAFVAETVVEAANLRDAIARAEALGATDITSISVAD